MPDLQPDLSSYPQASGKPTNPLDTLNGVANLQSTLNQNRLFQQEFNSKLGLSQIYKQAIDPATGQIDPAKINALLAGPGADNVTLGLPQAIQNSQEAQQRNIGIDSTKLKLAQDHVKAIDNYISPLLQKPDVNSSDVVTAIGHAIQAGVANPQEGAQLWSTLPRGPDGKVDEGQVGTWLKQQQMQLMSAQERLNAMSPAPVPVNTGASTKLLKLPQVGAPSQVGEIANTLPPTTQVIGPDGLPHYTAGPQSGYSPAQNTAGAGMGSASATQGTALQSRADQVPTNKALLGNLEGALNQFTSGPGADWKRVAASFANTALPEGLQINPKAIASQEEFVKQATQLAQSQFQQLGGTGANAQLDSAMHTSPNEALSKLGNRGIIAMLKGNEDAISFKNQGWQSWEQSHGPETYGQFSTQFNKSYDPRVFQSQYLNAEDNKKMLDGMTASEKKAFANNYRTALANGWVQIPGSK